MLERFARSRGPGSWYRRSQSVRFAFTRDRSAIVRFLRSSDGTAELARRAALIWRFDRITNAVRGYHTLAEMLRASEQILRRPGAVVVEAGAGKGSSTAKLSLAVRAVGGRLHVFDSFRGMPDNDETHTNLDGRTVVFRRGAFRGRLRSVQRTVARHGALEVCSFHKGWFADTLSALPPAIDVAVLDVDLLQSTRECLAHIVPRLAPGGILFSQDGHLRAIAELFTDRAFWVDEVGVDPPDVRGAGTDKLIELRRARSRTPHVQMGPGVDRGVMQQTEV